MKLKFQYTIISGILIFSAVYFAVSAISWDYQNMIKKYHALIEKQNYKYQVENTRKVVENATQVIENYTDEYGTELCEEKENNDHYIVLTRQLETISNTYQINGPWICEANQPFVIVFYPNKPEFTGMPLSSVIREAKTLSGKALTDEVENILNKFGKGQIDFIVPVNINENEQSQVAYLNAEDNCNYIVGANSGINRNLEIIDEQGNWFLLKNELDVNFGLIIGLFISLLGMVIVYAWGRRLSRVLQTAISQLKMLYQGKLTERKGIYLKNEMGEVAKNIDMLRDTMVGYNNFANRIKKREFEADLKLNSTFDELGNTLLEIRDNIVLTEREVEKQKYEDEKRQWVAEGMAQFIELFSKEENDLKKLSEQIISSLIIYLGANQGGLFILSEDKDTTPFFDMMSCYAYDRYKLAKKRIEVDDGLFGRIYNEGKTIVLSEIPDDYIYITSGLGYTPPNYLIIVPLLYEKEMLGVIEIATFNELKKFKIDFIEKVCENIASAISARKINLRTTVLLGQSQKQQEELARHEKILRNSMERMKKAQVKAKEKEEKSVDFLNIIDRNFLRFTLNKDLKFEYMNSNFMTAVNYYEQDLNERKFSFLLDKVGIEKMEKIIENMEKTNKPFKGIVELKGKRNDIEIFFIISNVKDNENATKNFSFLGLNPTDFVSKH